MQPSLLRSPSEVSALNPSPSQVPLSTWNQSPRHVFVIAETISWAVMILGLTAAILVIVQSYLAL